jgi:hypothetical protein
MLVAPLLIKARAGWLWLAIAVALIWSVAGWYVPILLRPAILAFFALGLLARRSDIVARLGALPWWMAIAPFALVAPVKIGMSVGGALIAYPHALAAVDLALRVAAALLTWRLAIGLARTTAGRRLVELERYAFVLFCSHLIFMWLIGPAIGSVTGLMGDPLWPLFFLAQPLLALGFAIVVGELLMLFWPEAARILSGGRLVQAASPAARPLAQAH